MYQPIEYFKTAKPGSYKITFESLPNIEITYNFNHDDQQWTSAEVDFLGEGETYRALYQSGRCTEIQMGKFTYHFDHDETLLNELSISFKIVYMILNLGTLAFYHSEFYDEHWGIPFYSDDLENWAPGLYGENKYPMSLEEWKEYEQEMNIISVNDEEIVNSVRNINLVNQQDTSNGIVFPTLGL